MVLSRSDDSAPSRQLFLRRWFSLVSSSSLSESSLISIDLKNPYALTNFAMLVPSCVDSFRLMMRPFGDDLDVLLLSSKQFPKSVTMVVGVCSTYLLRLMTDLVIGSNHKFASTITDYSASYNQVGDCPGTSTKIRIFVLPTASFSPENLSFC